MQRLPLRPLIVSTKRAVPFGAWPSSLGADRVADGSVRLGGIALDGEYIYWVESRAAENGRLALVRKRTSDADAVHDVVPAPFSVRTRVHEYGGGAFTVHDGRVVFANDGDQQLYCVDTRQPSPWQQERLTDRSDLRFADLQIDPLRQRVICVGEKKCDEAEPEKAQGGPAVPSLIEEGYRILERLSRGSIPAAMRLPARNRREVVEAQLEREGPRPIAFGPKPIGELLREGEEDVLDLPALGAVLLEGRLGAHGPGAALAGVRLRRTEAPDVAASDRIVEESSAGSSEERLDLRPPEGGELCCASYTELGEAPLSLSPGAP